MKWTFWDIIKAIVGGGSFVTVIGALIGKAMGWIRFSPKDRANVGKVNSETAIDLAVVIEKRVTDEIKISDAALQWTINLASQLEKANMTIEKKQIENERLHGIIDTLKEDFDRDIEKIKKDFNERIQQLEDELEKSRKQLNEEREKNNKEMGELKKKINGGQ